MPTSQWQKSSAGSRARCRRAVGLRFGDSVYSACPIGRHAQEEIPRPGNRFMSQESTPHTSRLGKLCGMVRRLGLKRPMPLSTDGAVNPRQRASPLKRFRYVQKNPHELLREGGARVIFVFRRDRPVGQCLRFAYPDSAVVRPS